MSWSIATLLALILVAIYFSPAGIRFFEVRRLEAKCVSKRAVALTYDDGPSPETTPRLLDLLGRRGVKATFFMSGSRVALHPELVDLVRGSGHEIGSHAQDHLNAWRCSPRRALDDLERGYASLSGWIDRRAPFRPPYGKLNALTWFRQRSQGSPVGWWTVDSGDTKSTLPDPGASAETVRKRGGGVVLFHEAHRSPERKQFVLRATEELLEVAQASDLRLLSLSELLQPN